MLLPRIIPCLLIHNNGLVKSVNFTNYKYIGDPINAVNENSLACTGYELKLLTKIV